MNAKDMREIRDKLAEWDAGEQLGEVERQKVRRALVDHVAPRAPGIGEPAAILLRVSFVYPAVDGEGEVSGCAVASADITICGERFAELAAGVSKALERAFHEAFLGGAGEQAPGPGGNGGGTLH